MKTTRRRPKVNPKQPGGTGRLDDCRPFVRAVQAGEVLMAAWAHGHYPGLKLPSRVLPGLNSVGFWDASHQQSWATDPHCNEGSEFTYVENGWVSLDLEGNRYILKLNRQEDPVWRAGADMKRCFCRIAELVQADDYKPGVAMMALMVNEVVLLMLEQMRQGDRMACSEPLGESAEYVQAFWHEITENRELLFWEWTLAKMARHCGLGVTQFVHLTKRLFNFAEPLSSAVPRRGRCRAARAAPGRSDYRHCHGMRFRVGAIPRPVLPSPLRMLAPGIARPGPTLMVKSGAGKGREDPLASGLNPYGTPLPSKPTTRPPPAFRAASGRACSGSTTA